MNIVVTQRANFVQAVVAARILDSQVVLSAIEYVKVTLKHCACRAALLEFAAPRQRLQLWELPGRWREVFAGFPRYVRIAYVISGKAFDGNADFSSYFNHSGEVCGKLFYNCRDAIEWLDHYDLSRVPSLVRSPRAASFDNTTRVISFDNATLRMQQADASIVINSRQALGTREKPRRIHGGHDI
jgi:hypothetical protein